MTSIAAHERTLLCALAQQLGPDAPTLCGDWTVRDLVVHLLEFYVHHEDVRRAQPSWEPRALTRGTENGIWGALRHAGRGTVLRAPVGVVGERADTGARTTLKKGEREVVVRGLPSEVALFAYGRQPQARVELLGDPADVAALQDARLGI